MGIPVEGIPAEYPGIFLARTRVPRDNVRIVSLFAGTRAGALFENTQMCDFPRNDGKLCYPRNHAHG